jgi:uncharacterized protein (DUF924 family)
MDRAEEVLAFWLDEVGPERWYSEDEALDAECARRFEGDVEAARRGALKRWSLEPRRALALTILLDQLPRNIWRGEARAFASDRQAVAVAKRAIQAGHDMKVEEPARQFFYLPLMHSENAMDQDRCVRLVLTRMPRGGAKTLPHAIAHRDIIRRFSRFPMRDAALGRTPTREERAWLEQGGYPAMLEARSGAA